MSWSGYSYVKREGETSSSMVQYAWTTCSKVIQSEVTTLQTKLQRLLGKNLLGIYLHGSLALGGFQPGRSDIDVIVVTAQRVDLETKRRCIEPLLRISKKMPSPLDIRFLVQQDQLPFQQPLPCDLYYSEIWRENYHQDHPLIQQAFALYRGERLGRPVGHVAWNDFAAHMSEAILL